MYGAGRAKASMTEAVIIQEGLKLHDGGRYHIETSPFICSANQWTGFYMITASVMKGFST